MVQTPHRQPQAKLDMLEVGGSGSSGAILMEIGKCGKTYNIMYPTSESKETKEWTGP